MRSFPTQPIVLPVVTENTQALLKEIQELRQEVAEIKKVKANRKRRSREEIERDEQEYNPYKSNGILKARPSEPIKSYGEFLAIQNYFLEKNNIRNWALWTVGVSLGFRMSDLAKLRINWVLNPDKTFKNRIDIREKKTSKRKTCLITESVVYALTKYFESINWDFNMDDYIFKSQKGGKLLTSSGRRILSEASKKLNIDGVIGSHTMRKSFLCIAYQLGTATVDPYKMEALRVIMRHDDSKTTLRYLGAPLTEINDEYLVAVSDFVLGRSGVNELSIVKKLLRQNDKLVDTTLSTEY